MQLEPLAEVAGIESPSLVDLATERLRAEILSGELQPGDRIVEDTIRRRYGISRAPLREALRLLAQQGLVEHLPRRGMRVTTWSPTDIRQLFEIRHVLERHAVLSALPLSRGEDDPLARVRALLADMRTAEQRGDRLAKDDAHRAFHAAVVGLAGNRQLELALAPILLKLQLPMAVNLRREADVHSPAQGLDRHAAILAALESDDAQTVLDALDRHGELAYLPL
ncbi:GntR family transcriptional regulator [Blastococcus sp. CT_GayMR16]|uniref:GntR family transcriptional regulator n=1 Tax=Blastococcus sp. CT_GayMR16 TaxID=2559607 RepID=UPI001ADDD2D8|nr:GntR family transcriptional regulator [Blastococcus sp. CT_GayMR16]